MTDDFSKAKRGAVIPADPNKQRITIRLDADIIQYFKDQVHEKGGGNYQSLINDALRSFISEGDARLESKLRKIIREELRKAG